MSEKLVLGEVCCSELFDVFVTHVSKCHASFFKTPVFPLSVAIPFPGCLRAASWHIDIQAPCLYPTTFKDRNTYSRIGQAAFSRFLREISIIPFSTFPTVCKARANYAFSSKCKQEWVIWFSQLPFWEEGEVKEQKCLSYLFWRSIAFYYILECRHMSKPSHLVVMWWSIYRKQYYLIKGDLPRAIPLYRPFEYSELKTSSQYIHKINGTLLKILWSPL